MSLASYFYFTLSFGFVIYPVYNQFFAVLEEESTLTVEESFLEVALIYNSFFIIFVICYLTLTFKQTFFEHSRQHSLISVIQDSFSLYKFLALNQICINSALKSSTIWITNLDLISLRTIDFFESISLLINLSFQRFRKTSFPNALDDLFFLFFFRIHNLNLAFPISSIFLKTSLIVDSCINHEDSATALSIVVTQSSLIEILTWSIEIASYSMIFQRIVYTSLALLPIQTIECNSISLFRFC